MTIGEQNNGAEQEDIEDKTERNVIEVQQEQKQICTERKKKITMGMKIIETGNMKPPEEEAQDQEEEEDGEEQEDIEEDEGAAGRIE